MNLSKDDIYVPRSIDPCTCADGVQESGPGGAAHLPPLSPPLLRRLRAQQAKSPESKLCQVRKTTMLGRSWPGNPPPQKKEEIIKNLSPSVTGPYEKKIKIVLEGKVL